MKKTIRGMTFIELLIGMVLIGVVAAMAVPRYVDAAQQARDDALWAQSVVVKNAHDAVLNTGAQPSVSALAAKVGGKAVDGGVQVQISGTSYMVPTYANGLCTEPTKSVDDKVGCVGAIAG
ncbi:MAG TPA: prepilin-type N-terminal cleavage/methylation domain-containing protein [Gammaproteobacteria bacterium]|nr:prepilin-type N-terminal cleavage/methylation domain-containing protein [Gammaproteobacteria bacterium]